MFCVVVSEVLEQANRGGGWIIRAGPTNGARNTPQLDRKERNTLNVFRVYSEAPIGQLALVGGLTSPRWNFRAGCLPVIVCSRVVVPEIHHTIGATLYLPAQYPVAASRFRRLLRFHLQIVTFTPSNESLPHLHASRHAPIPFN